MGCAHRKLVTQPNQFATRDGAMAFTPRPGEVNQRNPMEIIND